MVDSLRTQAFDEILLQIRSGETDTDEGYQIIFARLNRYISKLLRQKLGAIDEETLKDLTATTLIAIWKNIDTWDPSKGKFTTWVSGITSFKAVDYMREYAREGRFRTEGELAEIADQRTPAATELLGVFPDVTTKQSQIILLQTLMKFDDLERTIFLLKIQFDLTFEELSQVLQATDSKATVKSVQYRYYLVRNKLRSVLEQALS